MTIQPFTIRLRRGTDAQWTLANPILSSGEPAYVTDLNQFKIGDGVTPWTELPYTTGIPGPPGEDGPVGPPGPVEEAPLDGEQYARRDGTWTAVVGGGGAGITDAPADGTIYARYNNFWLDIDERYLSVADGAVFNTALAGKENVGVASTLLSQHTAATNPHTQYLRDAPSNGSQYVRQNGTWAVTVAPDDAVEEAPNDGQQYVRQNGAWAILVGGSGITEGTANARYLWQQRPKTDADYAITDPTNMQVAQFNIVNDASPAANWPDRLHFKYDGVRTGGFNEFGEGRFDPAKDSTVALRVHGFKSGSTPASLGDFFEVREARNVGDIIMGVGLNGTTLRRKMTIINSSKDVGGLVVERTATSTTITDADIVDIRYGGKRATWVNEKGNLRTSNDAAPGEVAMKIIARDQAEGGSGNMLEVLNLAGAVQMRIGVLGRVNFNKGIRTVGSTLEIRNSTEADQTVVEQLTGGDLQLTPANDVNLVGGRIKEDGQTVWRQWVGSQAAYDAIGTKDPNTLYAIV
jgi:hypothetical protein